MEFTVKVDDDEVMKNLGKLSVQMGKAMQLGLRDTVVLIANDAINFTNKLTGNNARSITYNVGNDRKRKGTPVGGRTFNPLEPKTPPLTGMVYSTSGYGGYLETGTRYMDARPYIYPAVRYQLPHLGAHIKEHL